MFDSLYCMKNAEYDIVAVFYWNGIVCYINGEWKRYYSSGSSNMEEIIKPYGVQQN